MTESQVYWWLMLDNISTGLAVFAILIGVVSAVATCVALANQEKYGLLMLMPVSLLCIALACLIPNSKQYAVIKILPKIANSDFAAQVPKDMQTMYDMAKDYLKEKLTEEGRIVNETPN